MWTRCLGEFSVMWVTELMISQVKKRIFAQNDQIWPKIGIFGWYGPGHAGFFGALFVCRLVVVARGLYLARHLFTLSYLSQRRKKSVQPKTSFSCPGRHFLFTVQNAKCFPPILLSRLLLRKFSYHWYQDYLIRFGQWIKWDLDSIRMSCNVLRFKNGTNLLVTSNFPFRYWKRHPDYNTMKLSKIFAGPLTRKMCVQKRKTRMTKEQNVWHVARRKGKYQPYFRSLFVFQCSNDIQ